MLQIADDETRPVSTKERRPANVSQVLEATASGDESAGDCLDVPTAEGPSTFHIRVASNYVLRRKAYALAYRIYRRCGYIDENPSELCVSSFDGFAGTITLLAEDQHGREVGTISMTFDSDLGLPCNEIYGREVDALRLQQRQLVEITRLALEDDIPDARTLLIHLFSMAYIFARHVGGCSDLLVEVNPRHVVFYRRLLRFEQVGAEKPCPRVKGAPAVLLRMDCAVMEGALSDGHAAGRDREGRRLHPYPYSRQNERQAAHYMASQHRPMTFDELAHFKIARNSIPAGALAGV